MIERIIFLDVGRRRGRRLKSPLFVVLLLLLFAPEAAAQISVSGWTPSPSPTEARQSQRSPAEKAARGEAPLRLKYGDPRYSSSAPSRVHRLPAPDLRDLRRKDARKRLRVGVIRQFPHPLDAVADSAAYQIAEGKLRVLRVASTGALMLRLRFDRVALPDGARLFVYSAKQPDEYFGPYQNLGPHSDGSFWTPPVSGEEIVVEYLEPGASENAANIRSPFVIAEVSHIFKDPRSRAGRQDTQTTATDCQQDVPQEWIEAAKSVALLQFNLPDGEYLCTGTALNTTNNSGIPYVLTANHCIGDAQAARSVVGYWLYDQPTADGQPPYGNTTANGGYLVATSKATDFTLLRLVASRLPDGVRYSGWTTAAPAGTVAGIHHPEGQHKRIAFGNSITSDCPRGPSAALCDNLLKVRWSAGVTAPGSSGSGLWTGDPSDPKLVGTLLGGESSCANRNGVDYYGRFDLTFQAISYYLAGQGCAYSLSQTSHAAGSEGGAVSLSVTAMEGVNCAWTATSNAPWITITSGASGAAGNGDGAVSFTVAPNPSGGQRTGTLIIAGNAFIITQAGAGANCAATPISFEQTVNGSLSAGGCRSVLDRDVYASRHTFTAEVGQQIAVSLNSTGFDGYLTLIGPNGEIVAEDDDGGGGENSRIPAVKGFFTVLANGNYTIEVASATLNQNGGAGSYLLSLAGGCKFTPSTRQALVDAVGGGNGGINLAVSAPACYAETYPPYINAPWITGFSTDGEGRVSFSVERNDGPGPRTGVVIAAGIPYHIRQRPFCQGVSAPNVSPTSLNISPYGGDAQVNITMRPGAACTWLSPPAYSSWISDSFAGYGNSDRVVTVSVYGNHTLGTRVREIYIAGQPVTITQESPAANCQPAPLALEQTINASLSANDCRAFTQGGYADHYTFSGVKGQQVALTTKSPGFMLDVRIYNPSGEILAGYGSGLPPSKEVRLPAQGYFDLPADGDYRVVVSSLEPQKVGDYSINLTGVGGPGCSYQLTPNLMRVGPAGGTGVTTLSVNNGCAWTATTDVNWVTFPEGNMGSGSKEIKFSVASNSGVIRYGQVSIAGRGFAVVQDAPCGFLEILPGGPVYVSSMGELKSFQVITGASCNWTAASRAEWITVYQTQIGGDGQGSAVFTIRTNEGPFRTGQVEVAGKTVEIRQGAGNLAPVSSASYTAASAAGSLITVFGQELAPRTQSATNLPLPTSLGGARARVIIVGYGGFDAPMLYASPTQINFQIPENAPAGPGLIEITSDNEFTQRGLLIFEKVTPGLFAADASGSGVAAAVVLRVKADGAQVYEQVAQYDAAQQKFIARPIDLGDPAERVFLLLFGTGLRNRSSLSAVEARIGGEIVETLYAGAQGDFAGLDQVNLRLSPSLAGVAVADVVLTVDGKTANTVKISIK